MKKTVAALVMAGLCAALATAPSQAEEVTIRHNGLTLNADLNLADGKTIEDGVVLMTHAALQHNRMEIIRVITGLFRERGYSTLAITYSAGLDNRRGPYDCAVPHRHSFEGHLEEIGLWVDWLRDQGARQVIMAGHSGGANRIAQFMVGRHDPLITRVVMFAPGTADHFARSPEGYRARYRKDIGPILQKARSLVESGNEGTFMVDTDFLYCPRTKVTAASFLSYYGAANRKERLLRLQMMGMRKPTIVIAASEDNVASDMARMVKPYVAENENLRLVTIEGCGHYFRDLCADDAVEAAVAFLAEKQP